MEEKKEDVVEEVKQDNTTEQEYTKVPAKVSVWSKIKGFLFHEITITLTPKQEAFFKRMHDFWHQDITFGSKEKTAEVNVDAK